MADWGNWLVAAGVLIALELFTGTFYLLMIAIGMVAAALAALAGLDQPTQITVAAVVGVAATVLLRRSRWGRRTRSDATRDPNVNIDIGQDIVVDAWEHGRSRVMYRGAMWDVELCPNAQAAAGRFKIVEVQGSRLIVANS
ncbi:NfeD family protein [Pseudoduganella sp. GCM10020061]|uniref:NfeD family protein n=1 Tax=Pseudoduganella sp. GCM10020061 TaxID=3317345 RepID=UPI0036251B6D